MPFSFVNPYNFIPLEKSPHEEELPWKKKLQNEESPRNLTGKIEYTLTTLTPLFIPNTSNDRVFSESNALQGDSTEEAPIYHKSFEFFSYRDFSGQKDRDKEPADYLPVIPGSEIRGAIRSIYEALTDSCLSAIDMDAVLSKRTPEYFSPGILEWDQDGGWNLYQVTNNTDYLYRMNYRNDFSVKTFSAINIQDGVEVTFKKDTVHAPDRERNSKGHAKPLADDVCVKSSSQTESPDRLVGYLVKGEAGPDLGKPKYSKCSGCPPLTKSKCEREGAKHCYLAEKHCAHIFVKPNRIYKHLEKELVTKYEKQISQILKIYKDNKKSPYEEYARTWEEFKKKAKDGIPIYFSEIADDQLFFSPACVTREVYLHTLKDIVGNYAPCSGTKSCLCPACRLFGTIHGGAHIRSRVRFSDLHLEKQSDINNRDNIFLPVTTLPELSTPKMTTTEFYLQKPDAENILNWTYDYYITINGQNTDLVTYIPVISGRKFYWHSNAAQKVVFDQQDKIEINERNKTVRPVADHVQFKGTLFFDKISERELQELVSIMNISCFGKEDEYAIKLGAAKPLGFGSVSLKVDQIKLRNINKENFGITYKPDAPYSFAEYDLSMFNRDDIIRMFDTQALAEAEGKGVLSTYPKNNTEDEGYAWYMSNRFAGKVVDRNTKKVDIHTNRTESGPRYRWQIAYRQYMVPLQPELKQNPVFRALGGTKSFSNRTAHSGIAAGMDVTSRSTQYPRKTPAEKHKKYAVGTTLEGRVIGHKMNNNSVYVYAIVEADGKEFRVHVKNFETPGETKRGKKQIKNIAPEGASVIICYKGINDTGYDEWTGRRI